MPPVPRASGRDIVRALVGAGWILERVRGSHHRLKGPNGERVTVAVHGAATLPVGTTAQIIADAEMTTEEFIQLLRG